MLLLFCFLFFVFPIGGAGDMKAVFLLLYWGADPNTPDKSGDTPLLWLLRNRGGTPTSDTIRLLLRFGADATYQNPNDGYSALHLLCCKKKVDKSLAIAVYKASGYSMTSATDSNGWTPHTVRSTPCSCNCC